MWPLFEELQDPDLQKLADNLPNTVLHSKADTTARKYLGSIRRWKQWAISHKVKPFPVASYHLVLYLQHIGETVQSKSAVEEIVHAMTWLHNAAGIPSPSTNPIVSVVLAGLQKTLARPVVEKVAIQYGNTNSNGGGHYEKPDFV